MNTKITALVTCIAMATLAVTTGGAAAYVGPGKVSISDLVTQTAAITPLSMQYFCAEHRSECTSSRSSKVTMTPDLMNALKQVTRHVNRSIRPVADSSDVWSLNPTSGDCEDYVLSKRSALIGAGVSSGSLRIAYTHTRAGEPHAVLVVRTNEGDYVLDNLNNSVKTLRSSGYNIRSMSTANPNNWIAG